MEKVEDLKPSAPTTDVLEDLGQSEAFPASAPPLERLPSFSVPVTQVELTLSARSLINLDQLTHSDPMCILYILDSTTSGEWLEWGRTEAILNNLNPEWKTKFLVDYRFEEKQLLTFMVYDKDARTKSSIESHDFLGKVECSMGEIVSAPHSKLTRSLTLPTVHDSSNRESFLIIFSEEIQDCKKFVSFELSYSGFELKQNFQDGWRSGSKKNKVFANISKKASDSSWTLLYRTDVMSTKPTDSAQPSFQFKVKIRFTSMFNKGNLETPLRIQIHAITQSVRGKSSKLVGEVITNYIEMDENSKDGNAAAFPMTPPQNCPKEKSSNLGILQIQNFKCETEKSFMDYIQDGLEINFAVAIDFTSSNGEPTSCRSLHYKQANKDSPYAMTVKIIGDILQDYSSTKKFYAYGFGAKGFPLSNRVNHKFPLNFKETNPQCDGIEGILSAYYRTLKKVTLYGPTCFAPIIREVAEVARKHIGNPTGEKYFVLVILTDGIVCDPETTRTALVEASNLPMSVIIIGIGDEDFAEMEKLDSDDKLLKNAAKEVAKRDIVQFVELRKYVNFKSITPINAASKIALSRSVLAELPQQVVTWMNLSRT